MRERLIGYGLGAWRRRWLGVATAWLVCLIGWSATLLLTGDPGSSNLLQGDPPASAAPQGSERAAAASPVIALEAGGGGAPGKAAQPSQEARQKLATLQSDLAAALLLRGLQARRLASLPPALDGGRQRNPLHERAAIQLGQQAALIAALQRQIAAEQARILALEGTRRPFDAARVPEDLAPERALSPVGVPHALTRPALAAADRRSRATAINPPLEPSWRRRGRPRPPACGARRCLPACSRSALRPALRLRSGEGGSTGSSPMPGSCRSVSDFRSWASSRGRTAPSSGAGNGSPGPRSASPAARCSGCSALS